MSHGLYAVLDGLHFLIMIMYETYCKKKYKRLASISFLVATTFIESFLINIF